jgi:transcriptional regulator with XRE-family HTH domain
MQTLGERIAFLRKARKLTQEQVGKVAGITQQCINDLEHDRHSPSIATLMRVAGGLGMVLRVDFAEIDPREIVLVDGKVIERALRATAR